MVLLLLQYNVWLHVVWLSVVRLYANRLRYISKLPYLVEVAPSVSCI